MLSDTKLTFVFKARSSLGKQPANPHEYVVNPLSSSRTTLPTDTHILSLSNSACIRIQLIFLSTPHLTIFAKMVIIVLDSYCSCLHTLFFIRPCNFVSFLMSSKSIPAIRLQCHLLDLVLESKFPGCFCAR